MDLCSTHLSPPKRASPCSLVSFHVVLVLPSFLKTSRLDLGTSYNDREGCEDVRPGLASLGLAAFSALGPSQPGK